MGRKATTKIVHSVSPDETHREGEKLGTILEKGDLLLLAGDLGSGKTCFVQGLAEGLGIKQHINSPTYVYVHPYKRKRGDFFHIDLYRVTSVEKLRAIGVEDLLFDGSNIMAIEWPELILQNYDCLSFRRIIHVQLKHEKKEARKITITFLS
jgi:tRNA threonylcarbamoyladenosine biosynthesis protein TsaE